MSGLISHVYQLHDLFKRGRRLTIQDMARRLDCSRRTVLRVKKLMCQRLGAPITCDSSRRVFSYDERGDRYELPGIWLSAGELTALATLANLAESLDPGMIRRSLAAARRRITKALRSEDIDTDRLMDRIRVLPMRHRAVDAATFSTVAEAIARGQRVRLEYRPSTPAVREVSPQQLVRYCDNWYLDAFCHVRESLRTFALNDISQVECLRKRARIIGKRLLMEHFAGNYGLFSGPAAQTATIHFTGPAARYASAEQWHPNQTGKWISDDTFELQFPFGEPRELAGDIMRWGQYAEVVEPANLREHVRKALWDAALRYDDGGGGR